MSEELKEKALQAARKLCFHPDGGKYRRFHEEELAEDLAEFASQVCEKRAKLSSKLTPSEWLRENGFGDSAVASDVFDKDGDPHALIGLMDEYGQERAEAAELALQQIKENDRFTYCAYCNARFEVDKSGQLVADHIRTCDKHPIGAALQAKEQELRKELDVPLCGDCAESWFTMRDNLPRKDGCVFCASVAQARQQAVADLRNVLIAIPISNELRGNRYDCEDTHTLHIWSPPLDKSWDVIIPKVKP